MGSGLVGRRRASTRDREHADRAAARVAEVEHPGERGCDRDALVANGVDARTHARFRPAVELRAAREWIDATAVEATRSVVFAVLAVATVIPFPSSMISDLGYYTLCPFAPWSTLMLLFAAGIGWVLRGHIETKK